ncbi:hypothetical protein BOO88_10555 [Stutzerimonas stutzeri]|nr:hypothetical protein BOO89_08330 [Stutzerimonas stutzeri]AZO89344.1 hypothetical protein BOO88_10555 [Stutzerimonas stutzeri]
MKEIFVAFILSAVATWLSYKYGVSYSYSDFKDYGNNLLAISGMVFTIMGIWVAFIYPNAILRLQAPSKIKNADFTQTLEDTRRLESIVGCIMKSAFVATALCLVFLIKILASSTPLYKENIQLIKSLVLGVTMLLTILQGSAVASVMYANFMFIEDLHRRRESRQGDSDF